MLNYFNGACSVYRDIIDKGIFIFKPEAAENEINIIAYPLIFNTHRPRFGVLDEAG
jgi:hypothetical protein